jgi:chromosome transmission fidelity protein 4
VSRLVNSISTNLFSQASCGTDGLISIWDLHGDEAKLETTIDGIIPKVHDTTYATSFTINRVIISPTYHTSNILSIGLMSLPMTVPLHGTHLENTSLPYLERTVRIWPRRADDIAHSVEIDIVTVSRKNWLKTATFSDKDVAGSVTALAVSPNGLYLACAARAVIYVWSIETKTIIVKYDYTRIMHTPMT